jgi:multidrug transporter EmrE-like cation transporter
MNKNKFQFIKYLPILFEYAICAAICWVLYTLFLVKSFGVDLGYVQWLAIIVIATAVLPNNLKPSNKDDQQGT